MMMHEEYQEFLSAAGSPPPEAITKSVLARVRSELEPSLSRIFPKLTVVHGATAAVTLLFCPQFGVSPLGNLGLMPYLMRFGDQACMFGCGVVFMASTAFVTALVLRREEVRRLRHAGLLWIPALALLSASAFACTGGTLIVSLFLFWLLGSVLGGLVSLEATCRLRWRFSHSSSLS